MPRDPRETDDNSVVAPLPRGPRDLGREIDAVAAILNVFKTETRASLKTGAGTMGELRGEVNKINETLTEINAKRPINWVAWGGFALSVGALIFQAGRYPDRPEYNTDRAVQEAAIKSLKEETEQLEKQLIQSRGMIDRLQEKLVEVEKQNRLEQKVDALGRARR